MSLKNTGEEREIRNKVSAYYILLITRAEDMQF